MRKAHALIPNKAAEERHWDEAEEDDEENRPTDDSLWLWAANHHDQEDTQGENEDILTQTCRYHK